MKEVELGLGDPPERVYLYVQRDDGDPSVCWHTFDGEKPNAVHQRGLTGFLRGIKISEVEFRGTLKPKVDILIQADRPYVIRSGATSKFTRGTILALTTLTDAQLANEPICIAVRPGDEPKIVFSNLYLARGGVRVKYQWDGACKISPLIEKLQAVVGDGGSDEAETEQPPASSNGGRVGSAAQQRTAGGGLHGRIGREGFLTMAQYKELLRVAGTKTMDEAALLAFPMTTYGAKADELTHQQAIQVRGDLIAL